MMLFIIIEAKTFFYVLDFLDLENSRIRSIESQLKNQRFIIILNKIDPRLKEFEKKHLKTPWLVETVKTYSPILFQEWEIANIGKVENELPGDDLALRFNIKNEGYLLKKCY